MIISRENQERLERALISAFPNAEALRELVKEALNEELSAIASDSNLDQLVHNLITWTEVEGRVTELVLAACAAAPRNRFLRAIARIFRPPDKSDVEPERVVQRDVPFEDLLSWLDKMERLMRSVCRIEYPSEQSVGTGFLISPDKVMTNCHVYDELMNRGYRQNPKAVVLRFDFIQSPGQQIKLRESPHSLKTREPLDSSPTEKLDYAIFQLKDSPGAEIVEGKNGKVPRGYLSPRAKALSLNEPLVILQHPGGEKLKMAFGSVLEPMRRNRYVYYNVNTLPGSSGAPCFDTDLNLVAIHHAFDRKTPANRGILFSAILQRLRRELVRVPARPTDFTRRAVQLSKMQRVAIPADVAPTDREHTGTQPAGRPKVLRGHDDLIYDCAWSPDGKFLASASEDTTVGVWDVRQGRLIYKLIGHGCPVFSVEWSPNGRELVSSGADGPVRCWKLKGDRFSSNGLLDILDRTGGGSTWSPLAWSPEGKVIGVGGEFGKILLVDLSSNRVLKTLRSGKAEVTSLAWSPNGRTLASCDYGGTIKIWNAEQGELDITLRSSQMEAINLAWSQDGNWLVSGGGDGYVRLWEPQKQTRPILMKECRVGYGVFCVRFSPDGKFLAAKSWDDRVRIWYCDTFSLATTIEDTVAEDFISAVCFHPRSTALATLGRRQTEIRIWSLAPWSK
jgi:V8-like Glu-specific endopeptidase